MRWPSEASGGMGGLHPPRIVPFFVTARLGAQNDVTAYADVVREQPAGDLRTPTAARTSAPSWT
ncbi:UNVERIFIED_CONTAM: hypothetical protein RKD50_005672 [Streptomyces canus]